MANKSLVYPATSAVEVVSTMKGQGIAALSWDSASAADAMNQNNIEVLADSQLEALCRCVAAQLAHDTPVTT